MREHDVDALVARYEQLQRDTSFEEWRRLSHDVLSALVQQQGLVIALQRKALESQRHRDDERLEFRSRAHAAFTIVQRLHQLRRKIHELLAERRGSFVALVPMRAAS